MNRASNPSARRPRPAAGNRTGADGREAGQQRAPGGSAPTAAFDALDVLLGKHDDATVAQGGGRPMSRSDTDDVDATDGGQGGGASWEEIGRGLLRERLNSTADEARTVFGEVSHKISRGEDPTKADVEELYAQLEELRFAVDRVAETVPGSRHAGLEEYMTRDELEAVEERVRSSETRDGGDA